MLIPPPLPFYKEELEVQEDKSVISEITWHAGGRGRTRTPSRDPVLCSGHNKALKALLPGREVGKGESYRTLLTSSWASLHCSLKTPGQ